MIKHNLTKGIGSTLDMLRYCSVFIILLTPFLPKQGVK